MRLALVLLALASAFAQDPAREARQRFLLISTRATANFRSAESIEYRLQQEGMSLHPQLITLRARIEASLDDARDDLQAGRIKDAGESLDRAQAWLDRFARRLGGD